MALWRNSRRYSILNDFSSTALVFTSGQSLFEAKFRTEADSVLVTLFWLLIKSANFTFESESTKQAPSANHNA
jgi:hypothetical protein